MTMTTLRRGKLRHSALAITLFLILGAVPRTSWSATPIGFCDQRTAATLGQGSASQAVVHTEIFMRAYRAACKKASSVTFLGTGEAQAVRVMKSRLLPTTFAGSELAMSPADKLITEFDLDKLYYRYSPLLQIPLYVNGIAIAYNIPCRVPAVKFRSQILSLIFSGSITRWSDPTLVQDNPKLATCNVPIRLVKRADSAPATTIFKDFLAKRNPQWQTLKLEGANQQWPTLNFACSGGGDAGMANCIRSFRGAIGYVQLSVAVARGLTLGLVENVAGSFVAPSAATCGAAANSATIPPGIQSSNVAGVYNTKAVPAAMGDWSTVSITDAPNGAGGPPSYPICGLSYAFVFYSMGNAYGLNIPGPVMRNVIDYFWVALYDTTQRKLASFGYAPLPAKILQASREAVLAMTGVLVLP